MHFIKIKIFKNYLLVTLKLQVANEIIDTNTTQKTSMTHRITCLLTKYLKHHTRQ